MNLKRLRDLEAAATKGPWDLGEEHETMATVVLKECFTRIAKVDVDTIAPRNKRTRENALFIAEARNQMPELLSWIERAKAEFEYIKSKNHESDAMRKLLDEAEE